MCRNVREWPINQGVSVTDDGKHSLIGSVKTGEKRSLFRPVLQESGLFLRGFRNRRSPPVSFLRPGFTGLSVLGMCTVSHPGCENLQHWSDAQHPAQEPRKGNILHKTVKNVRQDSRTIINDRMAGRVDRFSPLPGYIGDLPRVTLSLSNLSSFIPEESGRTLRRVIALSSQDGEREGPMRHIFPNYLKGWAQGLIVPHCVYHWVAACMSRVQQCTVVYPGCT